MEQALSQFVMVTCRYRYVIVMVMVMLLLCYRYGPRKLAGFPGLSSLYWSGQPPSEGVIRVSVSYEKTTKETIDNAFNIMKVMTEDYKKRRGDPTLVKALDVTLLGYETEVPTDAEYKIFPTTSTKTKVDKLGKVPKPTSKDSNNMSTHTPINVVPQIETPIHGREESRSNKPSDTRVTSLDGKENSNPTKTVVSSAIEAKPTADSSQQPPSY
ncbi:hypothetical protein RB195_009873 [Necator americanus]|uniref:Uncharacterized protein n=1 Tax=Necator americanus TaxID=51031 RepID=A0ABR1CVB6_NECAM